MAPNQLRDLKLGSFCSVSSIECGFTPNLGCLLCKKPVAKETFFALPFCSNAERRDKGGWTSHRSHTAVAPAVLLVPEMPAGTCIDLHWSHGINVNIDLDVSSSLWGTPPPLHHPLQAGNLWARPPLQAKLPLWAGPLPWPDCPSGWTLDPPSNIKPDRVISARRSARSIVP